MSAGRLDQRVTLRRKVRTKNEYGTLEEQNRDLATVWAGVRPMRGRERDRGSQTDPVSDFIVELRREVFDRYELTAHDYIVWRGRELAIVFIRDAGPRPTTVEIECSSGAP